MRLHLVILSADDFINPADLLDPALSLWMGKAVDSAPRPVKMIGDEGYLLKELLQGVAYDSPGISSSNSKLWSQCGQATVRVARPTSLIRL